MELLLAIGIIAVGAAWYFNNTKKKEMSMLPQTDSGPTCVGTPNVEEVASKAEVVEAAPAVKKAKTPAAIKAKPKAKVAVKAPAAKPRAKKSST